MSGSDQHTGLLPAAGTIQCSNCSTQVKNTLHRSALAFACPHCGAYYVNEKGFGYKLKHSFTEVGEPDLPLNRRGKLSGTEYEIIGTVKRRQVGTQYDWLEYLLFNPATGFVTLSEFNGHWNLVKPISDQPRDIRNFPDVIQYKYNNFQIYNKYKSTVKRAAGEFPYDIFTDKTKQNVEWIAPPFMLVREKDNDEECWSLGEYYMAADIIKAFGDDLSLPEKTGVGATQLIRLGVRFNLLLTSTLVFIISLLLLQFVFGFYAANKKVISGSYTHSDVNKEGVIVTSQFDLTGGTSALQFDVYAGVNNDWFDLDIELINDLSGERFEVAKSIEFYTGYDDEGSWSEGSKSDYIIMSSVPDGRYHLNLYPHWNPNLSAEGKPFEINVFRDVALWANFWIMTLIALIIPLIQFIRIRSFEAKRWMESDYSPSINSFL